MTRHDEALLWDYAARELDRDDARVLEAHLDDCPECRERLAAVHVAREALETARAAGPTIAWAKVDEAIGSVVEQRLAAQARRPMLLRLAFGGALLATAAGLAVFLLNRPEVGPTQLPATVAVNGPAPTPVEARVDRAQGLSRVGSTGALLDGATLKSGDVLETTAGGRAFVHLPDLSHARLGPGARLTLTRAEVDDVTLTLATGHLAVRASHQDRKGFVVNAGALSVHVVGTIFIVTNTPEGAEVAVSEGRVAVDYGDGVTEFVDAGARLRVDAKGRVTRGLKVSASLGRELDEVTAVADATTAVETQAVVAAAGGRTSAPPLVTAQGAPKGLPRLDPSQARARQVTLPAEALGSPTPTPAPVPGFDLSELAPAPKAAPAAVEAPAAAPVTQRLEPKTELVVEGPDTSPAEPSEWASMPAPTPAPAPVQVAPAPAPAPRLADEPTTAVTPRAAPRDLEGLFLQHAEASLERGGCDRYLVGLDELAMDAAQQKTPRTELARVLRARCFSVQLRPRQAVNEFRKYLEEYPRGRFATEANEAVGE